MNREWLLLRTSLTVGYAVVCLAACGGALDGSPNGPNPALGADGDPATEGDGSISAHGDAGVIARTGGLPCEVADVLENYCVTCHQSPPVGGAHVAMLSRDDLLAASPDSPGKTVAEDALERIQDMTNARMPPAGDAPSASEIAAFASWVNEGAPVGSCESLSDGGSLLDPDFSGPSLCSSSTYWTSGNEESPRMRPGHACVDCHTREDEGPRFSLAGTVFETGHEPDDCDGSDGRAGEVRVDVTDADGNVFTLTPNQAGNFYTTDRVVFPITARVTYDGRTREMITPVDSGDCNSCHTENGREGAPGRVALP